MTRAAIATATAAPSRSVPSKSSTMLLQRKCACGGEAGFDGICEECGKDKLQRKAVGGSDPKKYAPAIVHEVLRTPGRSLDGRARSFMESRFTHSFGNVRIHTDAEAARSARAVGAAAYTVGRNVVFDSGRYAPNTASGKRLLAHELTHVVQQRGISASPAAPVTIAHFDSALERAADASANAVVAGYSLHPAPAGSAIPGELQRQGFGAVHEAEGRDSELEARAAAKKEGKPAPMDGKLLTPDEHESVDALITKTKLPAATSLAHPMGSTFLLHDTSASIKATKIAEEQGLGRGPLGAGVSAWVPRDTGAVVARPSFFEQRRPSTTEFEKALDTFALPSDTSLKPEDKLKKWTERRDKLFREVWNSALSTSQNLALDNALGGQGLTPVDVSEEKTGNKKKGAAHKTGAVAQLNAGSTEQIMTTAIWTVGELCKQVAAVRAAAVAKPSQDKVLTAACDALAAYFVQREVRVSSMTTVEIVQVGLRPDEKPDPKKSGAKEPAEKASSEKKAEEEKPAEKEPANKKSVEKKPHKKSLNTCYPDNPDIMPMPHPPYSQNQYTNVAGLYLRAAHIAGRFPSITTHFVVDAFIGDHCDPRCFNIGKLYGEIGGLIGHPAGCTYGIIPSYGIKPNKNNIWWSDKICGEAPPK